MKLKNIFRFSSSILHDAFEQNDVATVSAYRMKKDRFLVFSVLGHPFKAASKEMTALLVNDFTDKNWQDWGLQKDSRRTIVDVLFARAILNKRADLFDVFLSSDISFNSGDAKDSPLHYLIEAALPDDVRVDLAKKLMKNGTDNIKDRESLLAEAAAAGQAAMFDVLATGIGLDIRRNNEELLRVAAGAKQRDFCRHLVEAHGSSLPQAVTTAQTLGNQQVASFLEDLRQEVFPDQKAPPTIESLAREVDELRGLVRRLSGELRAAQAQISEMQHPQPLDKPQLVQPAAARGKSHRRLP